MEKVIEILEDLQPGVDYENETALVDEHKIASLLIVSLVSEFEEEFDITIPATEIISDNFNSAAAMWAMIQRLEEE